MRWSSLCKTSCRSNKSLVTRKIAKLVPVSHDPRSRIPSLPFLVNAITRLFDEKIPRSTTTKLFSCRHSILHCARNKARAAAYIAACPHKEMHERESLKDFAEEQGWAQMNDGRC